MSNLESPDQAFYEVDELLEQDRRLIFSGYIGHVVLKQAWDLVDVHLDMRNDITAVRSLVDTETVL
jgi:hypothetical protein